MKSYTDIEQSKKLAEILPLESADYFHVPDAGIVVTEPYKFNEDDETVITAYKGAIPCWSLAALFDMLRIFSTPTAFSVKVSIPSLIKTENGYKITYIGDYTIMINNGRDVEAPIESIGDNPVDACVDMIEKLHELNLL